MNVVIAINDKRIEKFIESKMPTVTVLSVVRRRDQVIDTVLARNPHCLILSSALTGKTEMREIITKITKLKPDLKIVYLYGERETGYKAFLDFLIRQGVYDFVIDEITEENLTDAILKNATFNDVRCFLLTAEESERIEQELEEKNKATEPEKAASDTKVLIVEKYIGNITVAVGGMFARCGCTHTAIEICKFFNAKKCDAGLVVSSEIFNALKSFYLIPEQEHTINGCKIYDNEVLAKQNHKIVIYDIGNIYNNLDKTDVFYKQNVPILLCPAAPWEMQRLTDFLSDNDSAPAVKYLFYPISDNTFKEYSKNLAQGNCKAYKLNYNPDMFTFSANNKIYSEVFKNVLEDIKKL